MSNDGNYVNEGKEPIKDTENSLPVLPLFGFDNSDEMEQDLSYIKRLYPKEILEIQKEVEKECDKLEYDASPMYHSYPDKVYFENLANHIYRKVESLNETDVSAANIDGRPYSDPHRYGEYGPCRGRYCCPGGYCGYDPYGGYGRGPNHNPWLRNTVNLLLLNELFNRRRRYRSYKRMF